ncbi:putative disease resistance protein RGA1 [Oryza glaberrima]|uniref:putative disease resistance protein RGA1 n=1 Tax=Oryza glaberrima TaxID=4538 RepID=UPI00224C3C54|nr:putative disease resistance protein RGA1 [Oryza glaberrima]
MAEVGGMLAAAVLNFVGQQISSVIAGQITLQWDFNDDLKKMKSTLESVAAVLEDAEKQSIKEASVRLWLKRLKSAAFAISDMIDEFEADTQGIQPPAKKMSSIKKVLLQLATMIPCLTVGPRIILANKMKAMRGELKVITDEHTSFTLKVAPTANGVNIPDERETSSTVDKTLIIGRDEDKQIIMDSLSKSMTNDFTVLPIYGIGGIGKTTLAKLVFNDTQFKDYSRVWVYVSQIFDLNKIGNSIISQLTEEESQLSRKQMVCNRLEKLLAGKKTLIVLDDLWENNGSQLDNLTGMLKAGEGSKVVVVVTTRNGDIAKKFHTIQPHKLAHLTDDMCWTIIKQKSAFESREDDKEKLQKIGRDIAKKCGGVALAAESLGYMLQSMTCDEWESVKDNDIWNIISSSHLPDQNVLASLMLTYSSMPSYLKLCFAYCAIFPKGHKIVKDDLIYQWVSLGFIGNQTCCSQSPKQKNIFSTRQLSERYIKQLLGLSFLQHTKSSSTAGVHHENVTFFTMHDLVHDLASWVLADEILVSSKKNNNGESSYRYALLEDSSKPLNSFMKYPNKIKALCFVDCAKTGLHYDACSGAKCLRVLDLSECFVQKLPDSIGQLRQLRYLSAPGIQDTTIPDCITKLSKLIYLNLHGSARLCSLPESIGEMDNLMHLDLSGCSGIQRVPQSFGKLKLSYLDLLNCSSLKGVSEFLGNLTKLQHLNLSYCQYVEQLGNLGSLTELQYFHFSSTCLPGVSETDVLGAFTKLEYLNLSTKFDDTEIRRLPEAMGSFIKLKYLNLSGWRKLEELPISWGNLPNLIHLDLSKCHRINGVPEALSSLTKLQYLNLSWCSCGCFKNQSPLIGLEEAVAKLTQLQNLYLSRCLDTLVYGEFEVGVVICRNFLASVCSLSNLEELDLSDNYSIETLPESIGDLRKLHTLNLRRCYSLSQLPKVLRENDNLKHLNVSECYDLDMSTVPKFNSSLILLPQFAVQALDGGSGSNLVLLQNVNSATELEISKLENVVTVEEAQRVRLKEKEMISELMLNWTRDARRIVEDQDLLGELEPPRMLACFKLQGYNSVAFPEWLMNIAPHHFPVLSRIDLVELPKCTCLPPLGQLPLLEYLSLDGMNGITKIDGEFCGGTGAFPLLENLWMSNMESLEEWQTMYSCSEGEGVSEFMFPMLKNLIIRHCPKLSLKPLPPNKVVDLEIESSDNVISSWPMGACASTSSFVSVKTMVVKSCKLPLQQWRVLHQLAPHSDLTIESCGDLGSSSPEIAQALSSLKELTLKGNDDMQELNWMGELTCLESLIISTRCLELKASRGVMRQLTSLFSLTLRECESILSLPEWLGELPCLEYLDIINTRCPQLKASRGVMKKLTSLTSLTLHECERIVSLPECLGDLPSLETLHVECCESILALPESLGELTSLKELHIVFCNGIKSLPDNIHKLTNLKILQVEECHELKKWCESEENKTKFSNVLNERVYSYVN